ncbi:MAG: TolC family protein [Gammaproteobacteria bacterium]|nr:TolC family protein [Gammaproteobacteria bacterium]
MATHAAEPLTLPAVMQLAEQYNPGLQASRDQVDVARGVRRTAQAYPNPELDIGTGPSRVRQVRGQTGQSRIIGLSQPIDYPQTRAVRVQGAEAGINVAEAGLQGARINLLTQVKSAFYDVLRRQDEMRIAQENFDLLGDVRDRVRLRVTIGESPRYELVKAEAELLEGAKNLESAVIRVDQAKGALRNLIGSALPENFEVAGKLQIDIPIPSLEELRREVMARSPDIAQSQARESQAAARLQLERRLRIPQVTVHGLYEEDPDIRSWRLGLSLPLPLWNRREGPIAEATAQLVQSQSLVAQQQLVLLRELETVYNNYLISSRQVDAFEAGLLREAEAALKVAEAAYRFGERGILDYLDALRVYRSVRQDFLAARFDVQAAIVQIERLRATDLSGEQNQ